MDALSSCFLSGIVTIGGPLLYLSGKHIIGGSSSNKKRSNNNGGKKKSANKPPPAPAPAESQGEAGG